MSVFEQLQEEINTVVGGAGKTTKYYACQKCLGVRSLPEQPTGCDTCKTEVMQWPGDTQEQAEERARRAKGVVSQPEPEPEPKPATKPKKRTVRKKAEKVVKSEEPTNEPAEESVNEVTDYRAKREAAIQNFIEKKGLNEISPIAVGTAVVQTVGFTLWVDRQPIFRLMQPFESPADFQRAYDEARSEQPALQIDCCRCSQADTELQDVIFKGDLIASTNNGNGTQWVRRGDKVELGAYKTKNGHIRFVVLGVKL